MHRGRIIVVLLAFSLTAVAQDPIASFWKATLARLAAEPIEATVEDTRGPLPYKKYRVDYRSLDGVRVRGYLAMPVRGGERVFRVASRVKCQSRFARAGHG